MDRNWKVIKRRTRGWYLRPKEYYEFIEFNIESFLYYRCLIEKTFLDGLDDITAEYVIQHEKRSGFWTTLRMGRKYAY